MIQLLDRFINSITMYRLTLWGLVAIALWSVGLAALGFLPFTAWQLVASALLLVAVCYAANRLLAKLFRAAANYESALITGLILFFVLSPAVTTGHVAALVVAGIVSMASKYLLAIRKKHLFNPTAVTAVLFGFFSNYGAAWWIGNIWLLPVVAVVGFLIIRKLRRTDLFIACLSAAVVTALLSAAMNGSNIFDLAALYKIVGPVFTTWPTVFFISIMVTEPLTTPPTRRCRIAYGVFIGALFTSSVRLGPIYTTPEVSLVIANIFSYLVSPKYKLFLQLVSKEKIGPSIYHFVFKNHTKLQFQPGQYLEWTLPHAHTDNRGNRRYFTIASAPAEDTVNLGVKIQPARSSSFKQALLALEPGQTVVASQLSGDFVLPKDTSKKLVFIAGGIGITPFRSMLSQLLATGEKRDITLLYASNTTEEFVFDDVLSRAGNELGVKVVYVVTDTKLVPPQWSGEVGYLNESMVRRVVPDYQTRVFYLSGPDAMVKSYKKLLHQLRVFGPNIVTDYFPGF